MKKWRCFPWRHRWTLDDSKIVRLTWDKEVYDYKTQVLYRCERCERVKVKQIPGAWVLEEAS